MLKIKTKQFSFRYSVVKCNRQPVLRRPSELSRKVMLYTKMIDDEDVFIVVDFSRPCMPITSCDVRVPFYPFLGEMVKVSDDGATWVGKVMTVDERRRTVKVRYHDFNENGVLVAIPGERIDTTLWDNVEGAI